MGKDNILFLLQDMLRFTVFRGIFHCKTLRDLAGIYVSSPRSVFVRAHKCIMV